MKMTLNIRSDKELQKRPIAIKQLFVISGKSNGFNLVILGRLARLTFFSNGLNPTLYS